MASRARRTRPPPTENSPRIDLALGELDELLFIRRRLTAAAFFIEHITTNYYEFDREQVSWLIDAAQAQSGPAVADFDKVLHVLRRKLKKRRKERK